MLGSLKGQGCRPDRLALHGAIAPLLLPGFCSLLPRPCWSGCIAQHGPENGGHSQLRYCPMVGILANAAASPVVPPNAEFERGRSEGAWKRFVVCL